jgi:hypothetical protein
LDFDLALKWIPLIDQSLSELVSSPLPDAQRLQEQWLTLARQWHGSLNSKQAEHASPNPPVFSVSSTPQASPDLGALVSTQPEAVHSWPRAWSADLRIQSLRLIQQARTCNAQDDERSVRQIDAILSELQDWTLRLGQHHLSNLYPQFRHQIHDVWLDQSQLDLLTRVQDYAKRASKIEAQSRSLTVFMDWHGLILNPSEWDQVGQVLADMRGQVRETEVGYRLVFPSSLNRMRVVPFMLKGQRYAVAASQYLDFEPMDSPTEGAGKIMMRSGNVTKALAVDCVLTAQNANVTPIPDLIERPEWLVGVFDGHQGEVYSCVVPI